jgi:Bax protein
MIMKRKIVLLMSGLLFAGLNIGIAHAAKLTGKRRQFVEKMVLSIQAENQQVLAKRKRIIKLWGIYLRQNHLSRSDRQWLQSQLDFYRIKTNATRYSNAWWTALLTRVDIVPTSLALAQAITESAWGRSRFAKHGNNYFGQWCFKAGCGLVPRRRNAGATHEVKVFSSARASVRGYLNNINRLGAYRNLRELRLKMREKDKPLNSVELARGLSRYSGIGHQYVTILRSIIKNYRLRQYDKFVNLGWLQNNPRIKNILRQS